MGAGGLFAHTAYRACTPSSLPQAWFDYGAPGEATSATIGRYAAHVSICGPTTPHTRPHGIYRFLMPARHMDSRGVRAFSKLSREQAEKLADIFDEDLLLHPPNLEQMRVITGPSFTDMELTNLAKLYLDLLMTKISDEARRDVKSGMDLNNDQATLLAAIAEQMCRKIDANRIKDNLTLNTLKYLGHPHITSIETYTEFRPLSTNRTIKRLIPNIVVDGIVHKSGITSHQPINFQMDYATAKRFLKNLQSGIDALEDEITDMRNKFGDDVVLD